MQAEIEVEGAWHPCELFSPHNEPPAKYFLPGGIEQLQPTYPQYNAKLVMGGTKFLWSAGFYNVRVGNNVIKFQALKPESTGTVWGNVP